MSHRMKKLIEDVSYDLERLAAPREGSVGYKVWLLLTEAGADAMLLCRLQAALEGMSLGRYVARIVRRRNVSRNGMDVVPGARIGPGLLVRHPHGIVIGRGVVIGADCMVMQGCTLGERLGSHGPDYPQLGNGVVVGAGATLLGGIHLGDGAKIAAGAVVIKDVPADSVAAGVPAEIRG